MSKAQASLELLVFLAASFAFLWLLLSLANSLNKEAKSELAGMDGRFSKSLACGTVMDEGMEFQLGEYSGSGTGCGTNYRLYHQKISTTDSRSMNQLDVS